jgi:hypothetical protein
MPFGRRLGNLARIAAEPQTNCFHLREGADEGVRRGPGGPPHRALTDLLRAAKNSRTSSTWQREPQPNEIVCAGQEAGLTIPRPIRRGAQRN